MASPTGRRRETISVTIDPALLNAVDLYVQRRRELDRSKVMDAALGQWYRARQEEAMAEQFEEPTTEDSAELRARRKTRRAAAARSLNRTDR